MSQQGRMCACLYLQNPTAMAFTGLHMIEQQLVMQLCDLRTLLALARCSRDCLAAASSDFAFRALSPMTVHLQSRLDRLLSSSLLRFCDLSLHASDSQGPDSYSWMLDAMQFVPRLREVHCSLWIPLSDWSSLLLSNNMRALSTLAMDAFPLQPSYVQLMATHLPALRCLKLLSSRISPDVIAALPDLLSLRELHLVESREQDLVLLSSTSLAARLDQLSLEGSHIFSSDVDLPSMFASFSSLKQLFLARCSTMPMLEVAVTSIPSLQLARCRWFALPEGQIRNHASHMVDRHPPTKLIEIMRARKQLVASNCSTAPCCIELGIVSEHLRTVDGQRSENGSRLSTHLLQAYKSVADESDAVIRFELIAADS